MNRFAATVSNFFVLTLIVFAPMTAEAKEDAQSTFRFARIFNDNMVLQQSKTITVWGWANPDSLVQVKITQDRAIGEKAMPPASVKDSRDYSVKVQYVESNPPKFEAQSVDAMADANGRWSVKFKPAKASFQPTWIIAENRGETIGVQNVLIGEVWVCAGQSNMGWSNFNRKAREAESADFPGLRYVAWHDSWYKPLDDVRNNISWTECSPQAAQRFSAVPYLYGMFLHRYLKVPVGIINVARGGTLGQTWCLRDELDPIDNVIMKSVLKDHDAETAMWDDPKQVERIMAEWRVSVEQAKADHKVKVAAAKADGKKEPRLRTPKVPTDPRSGWSPPAGLFNATVMPIRHLSLRGVLYYQGENQAFNRWTRYEYTFPKIPVSFRKAFNDDQLWFGCISQPGWGTFGVDPEVSAARGGYHVVRDIQRRALKDDKRAGMIATYPTGNSYIHPAEKLPVADYASLWALANVYEKPVVHRGNEYKRNEIRDGKVYLFFDSDPIVFERWKHIEKNAYWQVLPMPREGTAELLGFTIAGAEQRWYPAKARHTHLDGKPCIELSSDLLSEPIAARYGWAQWPIGNMVGRERLPLPTFRTDDWPLPVGVSYNKEAGDEAKKKLDEQMAKAQWQASDRKVRQMQIDLPKLETEHYLRKDKSDAAGLILAKIARLEAILDELQKDRFLTGQVDNQPGLAQKINEIRKAVDALKKSAD